MLAGLNCTAVRDLSKRVLHGVGSSCVVFSFSFICSFSSFLDRLVFLSDVYSPQVCLRNAYICGFSDQAKAVKGDVMDVRRFFCSVF